MNWAAGYLLKRAFEMNVAPHGQRMGGAGLDLSLGANPRAQLSSTGVTPAPITGAMHGNAEASGLTRAAKPPDPMQGWEAERNSTLMNMGMQLGQDYMFSKMYGGQSAGNASANTPPVAKGQPVPSGGATMRARTPVRGPATRAIQRFRMRR